MRNIATEEGENMGEWLMKELVEKVKLLEEENERLSIQYAERINDIIRLKAQLAMSNNRKLKRI